jgi:hypothetical protein
MRRFGRASTQARTMICEEGRQPMRVGGPDPASWCLRTVVEATRSYGRNTA